MAKSVEFRWPHPALRPLTADLLVSTEAEE